MEEGLEVQISRKRVVAVIAWVQMDRACWIAPTESPWIIRPGIDDAVRHRNPVKLGKLMSPYVVALAICSADDIARVQDKSPILS